MQMLINLTGLPPLRIAIGIITFYVLALTQWVSLAQQDLSQITRLSNERLAPKHSTSLNGKAAEPPPL